MKKALFLLLSLAVLPSTGFATEPPPCQSSDTACMTSYLETVVEQIEKDSWRDQSYREIAKTMSADGRAMEALPIIQKITNPDTQALTIRGIGMEAAMSDQVPKGLFTALRAEAEKIVDPPSYGIALTYIAMAQAFAGHDDGALATAADMKNDALRHKAYGETAEIQAEKGKFDRALESISYIDSIAYKNKAYKNVSHIFAEHQRYQEAFDTALYIENPVMKAAAIQFILDAQRIAREKKALD